MNARLEDRLDRETPLSRSEFEELIGTLWQLKPTVSRAGYVAGYCLEMALLEAIDRFRAKYPDN